MSSNHQPSTHASYLKIYPKRILATLNTDEIFEGDFTLLIEQYGLEMIGKKSQIKISRDDENWQIWVEPISRVETNQFQQFVETLSYYLFSVLKVAPIYQGTALPKFEVHFDDVYFALSGNKSLIKKLNN
jgi:hypothetical protein